MAVEEAVAAAREISETAPMDMSPDANKAAARPRGWLRRLVPREYLSPSRRWKPAPAMGRGLASSLSRWNKRLPSLSLSLSLRGGSASAVVDAVTFRVMYVVEAVVLGLGLSCFFLCCGCHL